MTQPESRWFPVAFPSNVQERLKTLTEMGVVSAGQNNWTRIKRQLFDQVTGLAGPNLFRARVDQLINSSNNGFVIAAVSCKNYQPLNEQYGQRIADAMMTLLARRLRKLEQPSVFIARLCQDRFALLINKAYAHLTDEVLTDLNFRLSRPIRYQGQHQVMDFVVGLTYRKPGGLTSAAELIKQTERSIAQAPHAKGVVVV